ncbi:hypothetical protein GCM10011610_70860 [Nocardia rhizosphaerihabitans]|uniref:Uncharacterized protein n=2 Tax=Nocardia rhizosphaerihabitans TaxID=1691570 RepID=A0ABQ2L3F6_9NOCA|nr:hypothetical protein GCM10011610_70860 [Nocardia rhizosphaerihabitans]
MYYLVRRIGIGDLMAHQVTLHRSEGQLLVVPSQTPESFRAIITFGAAARHGRRDARLPEYQRVGYHRQDFATNSGRHHVEE